MKFISSIFILLFVTYQFSTSITYFVGNCNNSTIAIYDQDEDDEDSKETKETKETKELKSEFIANNNSNVSFVKKLKSSKIVPFYLINKYQVATKITILPPEHV